MSAAIPAVRFSGVRRQFGEVRAIDEVSFDVADGEFFSLLGPSGSGKTTCLRLIAGFEQPDAGAIEIHGVNVAGVPPYQRDVNTVFQDYALFPHMSVGQNVEYGLMIRKVPAAERSRRAGEMLELVKLAGMRGRKPAQLSGGQRQRVALARALINRPRVLLLDEPLGALDLKLREQMQVELKALQRQVGITFVYVTHDQGEALSMSDRVAVFNLGRIEQIDTPAALYEHPATAFVAGFVGVSNLCEGEVAKRLAGKTEAFAIRPEKIRITREDTPPPDSWVSASGRVESIVYLGAATRYTVALDGGGSLTVLHQNADDRDHGPTAGARVRLAWQARHQQPLGGPRG
jgi:putative spermidine/putrescine transport system ATP-binding protein